MATRLSNIELCRIVSIVLVMLVHTTFQSIGWNCSSLGILLLAAFSIVGVNVFVLITGFFSAEPKKVSLEIYCSSVSFGWWLESLSGMRLDSPLLGRAYSSSKSRIGSFPRISVYCFLRLY